VEWGLRNPANPCRWLSQHGSRPLQESAGEGVGDGSQPCWSCPGGATPASQPRPSRAASAQPSADPTSPEPFPRLWAGLRLCCNFITLPGFSFFLRKQTAAVGRELESWWASSSLLPAPARQPRALPGDPRRRQLLGTWDTAEPEPGSPVQAKDPVLITRRRFLIHSLQGLRTSEHWESPNESLGPASPSWPGPPATAGLLVRTCRPPWGLPPPSSHPSGTQRGDGSPAMAPCSCVAGLEHADLQGRLRRLGCLLKRFAGGRRRKRAEFHPTPATPPLQLPSCRSYWFIAACSHPRAAAGAPSTAPARLVAEGSGGCRSIPSQEPQSPARAPAPVDARRRAGRTRSTPAAPAKSCRFGSQVLAASCAKPSANIWEGGKLARTARRERAGSAPARWELSVLLISLCQFISWQRARNESP